MVSALVVCALVLKTDDVGSIPTVHNVSTSLAVVSLMGKYFFLAQTKPPTLTRRNSDTASRIENLCIIEKLRSEGKEKQSRDSPGAFPPFPGRPRGLWAYRHPSAGEGVRVPGPRRGGGGQQAVGHTQHPSCNSGESPVAKFHAGFISHSGLKIEREISHTFEIRNFPQQNIPPRKFSTSLYITPSISRSSKRQGVT